MGEIKKDIRTLSQEGIIAFFESHGEKAFRAKQVYQWLWQKSANSFEEMTNLSIATRELLSAHFEFKQLEVDVMQGRSRHGCICILFMP